MSPWTLGTWDIFSILWCVVDLLGASLNSDMLPCQVPSHSATRDIIWKLFLKDQINSIRLLLWYFVIWPETFTCTDCQHKTKTRITQSTGMLTEEHLFLSFSKDDFRPLTWLPSPLASQQGQLDVVHACAPSGPWLALWLRLCVVSAVCVSVGALNASYSAGLHGRKGLPPSRPLQRAVSLF